MSLHSKLETCNSKRERDHDQKEINDNEYEGGPQVSDQKLRLEPIFIEVFIDALISIDQLGFIRFEDFRKPKLCPEEVHKDEA